MSRPSICVFSRLNVTILTFLSQERTAHRGRIYLRQLVVGYVDLIIIELISHDPPFRHESIDIQLEMEGCLVAVENHHHLLFMVLA